MRDENYYVVSGWMVNQLKLSGTELIVFAIIYGFTQNPDLWYDGSLSYMSESAGASKSTVQRALKSLESAGLITKAYTQFQNVTFAKYKASVSFEGGMVKMNRGYSQNDQGGMVKMTTNNKSIDNATKVAYRDINTPLDTEVSIPPASDEGSGRDSVPYQKIVDAYNTTCTSLPKCTALSEKRRKAMAACWKEFGEKVYDAFRAAAESDFLSGRSGVWSGCGFDWLTRVNNMLKVIEGTYANKNGQAQIDAVRRNPMARDYTGQYDGDDWEVV